MCFVVSVVFRLNEHPINALIGCSFRRKTTDTTKLTGADHMASMQHHMQQAEDSLLHVTHLHRHAPSWQVCAQRGLVRPGSPTLAIHSPGLYTRLRTTRQKGTATEPTPLLPHHLLPRRAWLTARYPRLCGAGSRGSINWEDVGRRSKNPSCWQAFVTGGAAEAEAFFRNKGEPVHCLSTRFEKA